MAKFFKNSMPQILNQWKLGVNQLQYYFLNRLSSFILNINYNTEAQS